MGLVRIGDVPAYSVDPLVRRSTALQQTKDAGVTAIYLNARTAEQAGVTAGEQVTAKQGTGSATLPLFIDEAVPDRCVRIPAAMPGTGDLGGSFGEVTLEKA